MKQGIGVVNAWIVGSLFLGMVGCATPDSAPTKSLYERLGGKPAITAVVDQVCMASGGPCTYQGRDMKTTHAGMKITTTDFNALVEDLVGALDTYKVPEQEKKELLGLLGPMKKDIVEMP